MNLEEINDKYGKFIWSIAGRYNWGIWDQTDVYNDILLQMFVAMNNNKIPSDGLDTSYPVIKSFIITKSIDIIRKEYKRQGMKTVYHNRGGIKYDYKKTTNTNDDEFMLDDDLDLDIEASSSEFEMEMEKRFIWEMLMIHLPPVSALFVYELTFPSQQTIDIAMRDQKEAREDPNLRMNVKDLRILPKHVAESLGPEFKLSKATMSRIKKSARDVCTDTLGLNPEIKKVYVTKG